MRIAIVASDYAPTVGGVQTAVRNIAHNAARMGHAVAVVSYQVARSRAFEMENQVAVHRFLWGKIPLWSLPLRALQTLVGMARVLRAFKPDVVYVHFLTINALYVLLLHYILNFRLVVSARGNDIQGIPLRSRVQRWMLARLFSRADAILFCSAYVQRDAASYLKFASPRAYVGVVGDGFDPAEFATPRAYAYPAPYLLAMGRLVHKKGFDLLVRAFAPIANEFPRVHLLIAGDGAERSALEKLIDELQLRDRVKLLGFCDRATSIALFWGCEFFVLSSRLEPLGIVVLEAMAAGKPVLATASGGVIDLMQPGVNGLLVQPETDALARGLRELLANPAATRALGERACATIQQHTWEAITQQFVRCFEAVQKTPRAN
jgi:glycosyltransferase involved in cell wall biosynthesis